MLNRTACTALLSLGALLTSGCATFEKSLPDNYTGPQATINDTGAAQSQSLAYIYEVTQVDGRKVVTSSMITASANQGRGFAMTPSYMSHPVPAKLLKLHIASSTAYAAPILAMTSPTCRAEGEVELRAEAGKTYQVAGKVSTESCEAWIQEAGSGTVVTTKVTGKGLK